MRITKAALVTPSSVTSARRPRKTISRPGRLQKLFDGARGFRFLGTEQGAEHSGLRLLRLLLHRRSTRPAWLVYRCLFLEGQHVFGAGENVLGPLPYLLGRNGRD